MQAMPTNSNEGSTLYNAENNVGSTTLATCPKLIKIPKARPKA